MQGRSLEGAGQEYGRSRAEAGAGKEQCRSRAGAGNEQASSKAGVVRIPYFIQIVLKNGNLRIRYWLALIGRSSRSKNSLSNFKLIPFFLAQN